MIEINDILNKLSKTEQEIYYLLFEIKTFKDNEKILFNTLTSEIKNLSSSGYSDDRLLELNILKNNSFDKIIKYNNIMNKLIDIVDNIN